jgi:hypothetical protein
MMKTFTKWRLTNLMNIRMNKQARDKKNAVSANHCSGDPADDLLNHPLEGG